MFIVKLFNVDPSSFKTEGCKVSIFESLNECKEFILEKHWEIDYDNCNNDLSFDEFKLENSYDELYENNLFYDNFEFEIEEVTS